MSARTGATRPGSISKTRPGSLLDLTLLRSLVDSQHAQLRLEAVRTLQYAPVEGADKLLRRIAGDEANDIDLRAEAVVGLAGAGEIAAETRKLLLRFLRSDDATLRSEALRSLRGYVRSDAAVKRAIEELAKTTGGSRPPLAEEVALALGRPQASGRREPADLLEGGDPAAGRRVFFHPQSAGCYKCHTVNGRGGRIGTDLSVVMDRRKLAESILTPSKEVAPQFVTWSFLMESGRVHSGLVLGESDGRVRIGTPEGEIVDLPADEIEERKAQKVSLMPENLVERLTAGELRDLLAYLETLK